MCPECDTHFKCVWNRVCYPGEVCMLRQYPNYPFSMHCSKVILLCKWIVLVCVTEHYQFFFQKQKKIQYDIYFKMKSIFIQASENISFYKFKILAKTNDAKYHFILFFLSLLFLESRLHFYEDESERRWYSVLRRAYLYYWYHTVRGHCKI